MYHADAGGKPACGVKGLVLLTIYANRVTCRNCKKK